MTCQQGFQFFPDRAAAASCIHRVLVDEASLDVRFPSADRWLALTVRAGAAVIPELAQEADRMAELLDVVQREASGAVDEHREGDALTFPMYANIVVASK